MTIEEAIATIERLTARAEAAEVLLKDIEHSGGYCPCCFGHRHESHSPTCRLNAIINPKPHAEGAD